MGNTKRPPRSAGQRSQEEIIDISVIQWSPYPPEGDPPAQRDIRDLAVVTTEKLVGSGGHVDVVRFAFRAFAVKELEHRFVRRRLL